MIRRALMPLTGEECFRTRVLCKSVVLLQWGQQRLLTKEAGTSVHIDAMKAKNGMEKYPKDDMGHLELWDMYQEVLKGKSLDMIEREAQVDAGAREHSWSESLGRFWPGSSSLSGSSNVALINGQSGGRRMVPRGKR